MFRPSRSRLADDSKRVVSLPQDLPQKASSLKKFSSLSDMRRMRKANKSNLNESESARKGGDNLKTKTLKPHSSLYDMQRTRKESKSISHDPMPSLDDFAFDLQQTQQPYPQENRSLDPGLPKQLHHAQSLDLSAKPRNLDTFIPIPYVSNGNDIDSDDEGSNFSFLSNDTQDSPLADFSFLNAAITSADSSSDTTPSSSHRPQDERANTPKKYMSSTPATPSSSRYLAAAMQSDIAPPRTPMGQLRRTSATHTPQNNTASRNNKNNFISLEDITLGSDDDFFGTNNDWFGSDEKPYTRNQGKGFSPNERSPSTLPSHPLPTSASFSIPSTPGYQNHANNYNKDNTINKNNSAFTPYNNYHLKSPMDPGNDKTSPDASAPASPLIKSATAQLNPSDLRSEPLNTEQHTAPVTDNNDHKLSLSRSNNNEIASNDTFASPTTLGLSTILASSPLQNPTPPATGTLDQNLSETTFEQPDSSFTTKSTIASSPALSNLNKTLSSTLPSPHSQSLHTSPPQLLASQQSKGIDSTYLEHESDLESDSFLADVIDDITDSYLDREPYENENDDKVDYNSSKSTTTPISDSNSLPPSSASASSTLSKSPVLTNINLKSLEPSIPDSSALSSSTLQDFDEVKSADNPEPIPRDVSVISKSEDVLIATKSPSLEKQNETEASETKNKNEVVSEKLEGENTTAIESFAKLDDHTDDDLKVLAVQSDNTSPIVEVDSDILHGDNQTTKISESPEKQGNSISPIISDKTTDSTNNFGNESSKSLESDSLIKNIENTGKSENKSESKVDEGKAIETQEKSNVDLNDPKHSLEKSLEQSPEEKTSEKIKSEDDVIDNTEYHNLNAEKSLQKLKVTDADEPEIDDKTKDTPLEKEETASEDQQVKSSPVITTEDNSFNDQETEKTTSDKELEVKESKAAPDQNDITKKKFESLSDQESVKSEAIETLKTNTVEAKYSTPVNNDTLDIRSDLDSSIPLETTKSLHSENDSKLSATIPVSDQDSSKDQKLEDLETAPNTTIDISENKAKDLISISDDEIIEISDSESLSNANDKHHTADSTIERSIDKLDKDEKLEILDDSDSEISFVSENVSKATGKDLKALNSSVTSPQSPIKDTTEDLVKESEVTTTATADAVLVKSVQYKEAESNEEPQKLTDKSFDSTSEKQENVLEDDTNVEDHIKDKEIIGDEKKEVEEKETQDISDDYEVIEGPKHVKVSDDSDKNDLQEVKSINSEEKSLLQSSTKEKESAKVDDNSSIHNEIELPSEITESKISINESNKDILLDTEKALSQAPKTLHLTEEKEETKETLAESAVKEDIEKNSSVLKEPLKSTTEEKSEEEESEGESEEESEEESEDESEEDSEEESEEESEEDSEEESEEESEEDSEEESDEDSEEESDQEQPEVFLYTSFSSGTHYMVGDTNRIAHILTVNNIKFTYVDLATNERAKKVWKWRSKGRRLPGVVREEQVLCDLKELEEMNESHTVWEKIIEEEVY